MDRHAVTRRRLRNHSCADRTCQAGRRTYTPDGDLTGLAKVRWRTKQSGFRNLRLTLKLANGTWLVSDYAEGPTVDWHESEFG